jgi:NAD(P)-dependent dehydrogenase (short-subunit alcohol dehydrogenase family)
VGAAAAAATARRPEADLTGKVALVTGGSRGLGLLLARELAGRGCRLLICARDADELRRAAADLADRGADVRTVPCDLRDPEVGDDLVAAARSAFGRLDIVVNNAGVIQVAPIDALEEEHFAEAMETMFWGPLRVTRAALPELRANRGRLVTITSIGGQVSAPHLLPYACAKYAELALSEGLDAALDADGVRVTTVVPGLMRTGSHRRAAFAGHPEHEFDWFALSAGMPVVSVDAERAARRIVDAVARGRRYLVLTPLARAVIAARGASPALTQAVLRVVDRALPSMPDHPEQRGGLDAGAPAKHPLLRRFTALNDRASARFNQIPAQARAEEEAADRPAGG